MTAVRALPPRMTPRVTFSSLVDILVSPAHRLAAVLHPQKYPKPGPVFGYKKATEQLVGWIVNGVPLNPAAHNLRVHEADCILKATALSSSSLLPPGALSPTSPSQEPTWSVNGVEISVYPDLLVSGGTSSSPSTGAVKLYMRKDPLSVGPMLAALLYYYRSNVLQETTADPSLCAVTDVQAGAVHVATGNYQRLVSQVSNTCQVIASLWPAL